MVDEAVTLGMTYGLAFGTASIIFRMRISKMQNAMVQYRLVWQSDLSVKAKTEKMNALVWNKSRWSLHLFPLLPALQQKIDAAQARYLRRILKPPAASISRISPPSLRYLPLCHFHLSRPAQMAGPHSPQTSNGPTPPGLVCTQLSAQPSPPAFTKPKSPRPPACRPPSDRLGPVASPSIISSLTDGPSHSSYFSTR